MQKNNSFGVNLLNRSDEYSLLAVQGPDSKQVVEKFIGQKIELEYYHFLQKNVHGIDMIISRTGYTGELGYEIYFVVDEQKAEVLWNELFKAGKDFNIQPVGLAARDSLRLEMGYCLYGNDIDQSTNPLEAGLGWITKLNKGDFIGSEAIKLSKESGLKRKLVAMISEQKSFPRHGYDITLNNKKIGHVTSGTVSPVLEKPIALGYVDSDYQNPGNTVNWLIRDKEIPAKIVKLPFIL